MKHNLKKLVLAYTVYLFCGLPTWSWAAIYSEIYVFGDSASDTGNLFAATGKPPVPPYNNGRFSNGPGWVEYLAERLGITYNQEANFAWGYATTGIGNYVPQVDYEVPGLLTQIDQYINNHAADPNALYVVWAGPNDFMWGFEDAETTITTAITNISSAVERLFAHGARHILVPNMMPMGRSPMVVAAGMAELMNEVSRMFNEALFLRLSKLDFAITYMDITFLSQKLFDNPEVYGFSNVTEPCLVLEPFSQCLNPDTYLIWDEVGHLTTAVQQFIANFVYTSSMVSAYYDIANRRVDIPHVEVVNPTSGKIDVYKLTMQFFTENSSTFTLIGSDMTDSGIELTDASVITRPLSGSARFDVNTSELYIPLVEVGRDNYVARLTLAPNEPSNPFIVQHFTITELVQK